MHIKLLSKVVVIKDDQNYEIIRQIDFNCTWQFKIHLSCCSDVLPSTYVKGLVSLNECHFDSILSFCASKETSYKSTFLSYIYVGLKNL